MDKLREFAILLCCLFIVFSVIIGIAPGDFGKKNIKIISGLALVLTSFIFITNLNFEDIIAPSESEIDFGEVNENIEDILSESLTAYIYDIYGDEGEVFAYVQGDDSRVYRIDISCDEENEEMIKEDFTNQFGEIELNFYRG